MTKGIKPSAKDYWRALRGIVVRVAVVMTGAIALTNALQQYWAKATFFAFFAVLLNGWFLIAIWDEIKNRG